MSYLTHTRRNHNLTHIRQFHYGGFIQLELMNEVRHIYTSDEEWWRERGLLPAEINALVKRIHDGYSDFHPLLVYQTFQLGEDIDLPDLKNLERNDEQGYCWANPPIYDGDWPSVCVPSFTIDSLLFKAISNILIKQIGRAHV